VLRAEVPAEKLAALKAATVFIKVSMDNGETSGTGFLVNRDGQAGYIATAAHLIHMPPVTVRRIECVFSSGEANEMTVVANVVRMDLSRDLAILKLDHPKLPDPIDVSTSVLPTETSPVFILGFPYGAALSTSHRNPAITISSAHVSSIRRDDNNEVAFIQLDGGIDPGNSGGPIVTKEGYLVGISVAKVVGSGIAIAIPASQLANALAGGSSWEESTADHVSAREQYPVNDCQALPESSESNRQQLLSIAIASNEWIYQLDGNR